MGVNDLLKEKRDDILRIASQHGARVFVQISSGSFSHVILLFW